LAEEITLMVHSQDDLDNAIKASEILFGKSTSADLKGLNEKTFLDVFEGVPQAEVALKDIEEGLDMIGALADKTGFLGSNGEARRELKQNSISVNKEKVKEDYTITTADLINGKYVLLQRGKKNYFVLVVN
jgi:tyrosyl-tRNA synthetase